MSTFPEPTWAAAGQTVDQDSSALLSLKASGLRITGMLIRLLQMQFSSATNITNPQLRSLVWTEDPATAKVYIAASYSRQETDGTRPALFVRRQPVTASEMGLRPTVAGGPFPDQVTGPAYAASLSGQHNIICEGRTGDQAEALAEEVFYRMLMFAPVIQDDLRLSRFTVPGYSDIKERTQGEGKQAVKSFFSIVTIAWSTILQWNLTEQSPPFRQMYLAIDPFKHEQGLE